MGNHHFYYQANHHTKWAMVSSSQVVTVTLPKALRQKLLNNGIVLYSNGSRQSPIYSIYCIYIHKRVPPQIAKLVNTTPITMVYDTYDYDYG